MCGIGTISAAPGSDLPVRGLTRWLLHNLAPRGRDASGVAWKRPDGSTLYRKSQGHPVRLAAHLAAVSGTRSLDRAEAVIAHTRWGTIGSPHRTENNHPIVRPGVAMVHNGSLHNAADLYSLAGVDPMAEVDSDALAALIETAENTDALHDRFRAVRGLAALAWLEVTDDPADRADIWIGRIDTRPLVLGWTRKGDAIAASTWEALVKSASQAGLHLTNVTELDEGTVIKLSAGEIVEWYDIGTGAGQTENTAEYNTRSVVGG